MLLIRADIDLSVPILPTCYRSASHSLDYGPHVVFNLCIDLLLDNYYNAKKTRPAISVHHFINESTILNITFLSLLKDPGSFYYASADMYVWIDVIVCVCVYVWMFLCICRKRVSSSSSPNPSFVIVALFHFTVSSSVLMVTPLELQVVLIQVRLLAVCRLNQSICTTNTRYMETTTVPQRSRLW
jgi:hypothetical protein